MQFDLADFRPNEQAQNDGVWVDFGSGASFKIAALEKKEFANEFRQRVQPYMSMGREVPAEEQVEIMTELMAKHIVLDWKGVFSDGALFPHSQEHAERLLTEIPWVRDRILEEARKLQNFRDHKAKKLEGNSQSASAGTRSSDPA